MNIEWLHALWGGVLIGIAVSLMLIWNGRVTGISGIVYGLMNPVKKDLSWRLYFVGGMVVGGLTLAMMMPNAFGHPLPTADWTVGVAGLLVGFGTVLGSGCTSGHGVCGISRLSPRSIVATGLFIGFGIAAVFALRSWGVLP